MDYEKSLSNEDIAVLVYVGEYNACKRLGRQQNIAAQDKILLTLYPLLRSPRDGNGIQAFRKKP